MNQKRSESPERRNVVVGFWGVVFRGRSGFLSRMVFQALHYPSICGLSCQTE
jgi:hypothetical protein